MVIGIIALLVGILLPALNKARVQAQDLTCMSNLRQIGVALFAYSSDNNGYLPAGQATFSLATARASRWFCRGRLRFFQYLSKPLVPESQLTSTSTHRYLVGTIFTCPRAVVSSTPAFFQKTDYLAFGYDYNIDLPGLVPSTHTLIHTINSLHLGAIRQLSRVRYGPDSLLAADGVSGWVSFNTCGIRSTITAPSGSEFDTIAEPDQQNRHPKGFINCLMCDGTVTPRQWIYSTTEIPIPSNLSGNPDPTTFPLIVQKFWFGHLPDSNGN